MSTLVLEAALEYACNGFAVLPCEPSNKEPCGSLVPKDLDAGRKPIAGSGGLKKASRNPATITEWWTLRPDAMIGIATGAESGVFVIDVDAPHQVKRGPIGEMTLDGRAAWDALVTSNGCPDTVLVETPGSGRHYYFRYDPARPVGIKTGGFPDGVHIRGDGGYVIAPPSIRLDGKAYAGALDRATVADAPDWVYAYLKCKRLTTKRAKPAKAGETAGTAKPGAGTIGAYDDDAAPFPYSPDGAKFLWSLLIVIPPEKRDLWLKTGAALHSLDDSWQHRRRGLWDEWAKRTTAGNFDPDDQEKIWEGFERDRIDGVTWRTIRFVAIEHGWRPRAESGSAETSAPEPETFVRGDSGGILKTDPQNVRLAIRLLGVSLRHNEFSTQTEVAGLAEFGPELTDEGAIRLRFLIHETFNFLPARDLVELVLTDIAHQNRFHPRVARRLAVGRRASHRQLAHDIRRRARHAV